MIRAGLALVLLPGTAAAQISPEWTAEKCRLYTRAWDHATAGEGQTGLTPGFLAAHDTFLSDGCRSRGHVCPVTPEEIALANMLSLMAVAEGMAGSFLPFSCNRPP